MTWRSHSRVIDTQGNLCPDKNVPTVLFQQLKGGNPNTISKGDHQQNVVSPHDGISFGHEKE